MVDASPPRVVPGSQKVTLSAHHDRSYENWQIHTKVRVTKSQNRLADYFIVPLFTSDYRAKIHHKLYLDFVGTYNVYVYVY